jgi:hypothetical protein
VALLGASLRASSTLHHVFVPITHAIPSVTAVSDVAELVISTNDSGIRYLGDVSRHFASIWEPTLLPTTLSFHVVSFLEKYDLFIRLIQVDSWATIPRVFKMFRRSSDTSPLSIGFLPSSSFFVEKVMRFRKFLSWALRVAESQPFVAFLSTKC